MGERRRKAERLGDAPIEESQREAMIVVARTLDDFFNKDDAKGKIEERKVGFVLLVFPFGDGTPELNRCNFISNGADRQDVVTLMREMIARFEGQPEIRGTA